MIINKRVAIAVLAGLGIAGLAGASASSLGGLNSNDVGSDDTLVASCDGDGIDIDYSTSYDADAATYLVDSVTFSAVAGDCDGQVASATLREGGLVMETVSATLDFGTTPDPADNSFTLNLTSDVSAELFDNISLVIEG